jgi:hypothetical protein
MFAMLRPFLKFPGRWGAALIAIGCGWLLNFIVYLNTAHAFPPDPMIWAFRTGVFCLGAWVLVGLPLAIWDPDVCSTRRRMLLATVLCGLTGFLMMLLFFGTFPPVSVFSIFGGLAFITAAVSMLAYAALTRLLRVRR